MLGLAQLLRDGRITANGARHRQFVDQIIASGQSLLALIQSLLDCAQSAAGSLTA